MEELRDPTQSLRGAGGCRWGSFGAGGAVGPRRRALLSPQFFASMLTYPFVLVSNLMAVNNCG